MPVINPYLTFNGDCEAAFDLYKSVFGGEFAVVMRFGDMDMGMPVADDEKNKIMHVALPIGRGNMLMGSDVSASRGGVTPGTNFSVAVSADSESEADDIWAGLAEGGNETLKMSKAPWGAYFGMCTDKFGIQWMVTYDYANEKKEE